MSLASTWAPSPRARYFWLRRQVSLHTYIGRGSKTFPVAARPIPAYFGYAAYLTCRGGGNLTIAQQVIINACNGPGAVGTSGAVQNGRLVIAAKARTTWQITLALAPDARTNGSVQSPVDADMSGADNGVRASGRGSGTAHFAEPSPSTAPAKNYRVRLVCHGSGVTLPGLTAERAKGLSTKTCFTGREYAWTYVRLTLPVDVRVVASAGTTWTVAIDPM